MMYCDETLYYDDDMPEYVISSIIVPGNLKIITTILTYSDSNGTLYSHTQADLWRTDHDGYTIGAQPVDRVVGVGAFIGMLTVYMIAWKPDVDQLELTDFDRRVNASILNENGWR